MNKAAMLKINEQFNKQISAIKYIDLYQQDDKLTVSSYWNPGENNFSDVVNAEREHILNR